MIAGAEDPAEHKWQSAAILIKEAVVCAGIGLDIVLDSVRVQSPLQPLSVATQAAITAAAASLDDA